MNQTNFWNDAAKYGAIIGGVSALCSLLGDATGIGIFGLVGFALYIVLLIRFTRRRTMEYSTPEREYDFGRRWGFVVATCLFIGIINGAYSVLASRILFTAQYAQVYDEVSRSLVSTGIYTDELKAMADRMMRSPLWLVFSGVFGQLIFGSIFGLIIAAGVQPPRRIDKQSE